VDCGKVTSQVVSSAVILKGVRITGQTDWFTGSHLCVRHQNDCEVLPKSDLLVMTICSITIGMTSESEDCMQIIRSA
jgi:hypothetical protein